MLPPLHRRGKITYLIRQSSPHWCSKSPPRGTKYQNRSESFKCRRMRCAHPAGIKSISKQISRKPWKFRKNRATDMPLWIVYITKFHKIYSLGVPMHQWGYIWRWVVDLRSTIPRQVLPSSVQRVAPARRKPPKSTSELSKYRMFARGQSCR